MCMMMSNSFPVTFGAKRRNSLHFHFVAILAKAKAVIT